jgi:inhibitor of cysteine peptidase
MFVPLFLALGGCSVMQPASAASLDPTPENVAVQLYTTPGLVAKSVTPEAAQGNSPTGEATPMNLDEHIVEFTENDSGKTVAITIGTPIAIHLTSQPSTGYGWVIEDVDGNIVVQEGEPQYTASSNLRGAEGTETWKFKSTGAGSTVLKLVYIRPFEKDEMPLRTFELVITVANS